jgi:hypothetical protein
MRRLRLSPLRAVCNASVLVVALSPLADGSPAARSTSAAVPMVADAASAADEAVAAEIALTYGHEVEDQSKTTATQQVTPDGHWVSETWASGSLPGR